MERKVALIGGGSWGTALATVLAENDVNINMWLRDKAQVNEIKETRMNNKYLPGVELSEKIVVTDDIEKAITGNEIIISAIPTQSVRSVLKSIKEHVNENTIIVNVSKGIEIETNLKISDIVKEELGNVKYCMLSGPSHAEEVGKRIPTTVVAASLEEEVAEIVQDLFMTSRFRVYTNPDIIGVELGGAFKNPIALAAGISDGLGYGDNTKAAIMTRGFSEMIKLGVKMGANNLTFSGLSGMGDLIVTCTSNHSRNVTAGRLIGEGYSEKEVAEKVKMVVEGIKTTEAVYKLAKKHGVEMPIINELHKVLYENRPVKESMDRLMQRTKRNEMEEIVSSNRNKFF